VFGRINLNRSRSIGICRPDGPLTTSRSVDTIKNLTCFNSSPRTVRSRGVDFKTADTCSGRVQDGVSLFRTDSFVSACLYALKLP